MRTASSASRTCGRSASASEYTATARIPIRRAVPITRLAISTLLATSIESNTSPAYCAGSQLDDRPAVHDPAEGLDGVGVVLAGGVEAQPLHRGRRAGRVERAAHQVGEGVGGPDDAAAQRRTRGWRGSQPRRCPRGLAPGAARTSR